SNGVIIIETTKRGVAGPPRMSFSAETGMNSPVRGYDDFMILNSLDYFKIVKASYENAGLAVPTNVYGDPNNPTVPKFIWPNDCNPNPCQNVNTGTYHYHGCLIMTVSIG